MTDIYRCDICGKTLNGNAPNELWLFGDDIPDDKKLNLDICSKCVKRTIAHVKEIVKK